MKNRDSFYELGVYVVGIILFIGVWLSSMEEWGFLLGVLFGWIPALIVAVIGGILWPFLLVLMIAVIFMGFI
ncbi:MAG TPA: hypothetical protein ENI23_16490 [bacterium]|nr:hypothetical protein [bacterium]